MRHRASRHHHQINTPLIRHQSLKGSIRTVPVKHSSGMTFWEKLGNPSAPKCVIKEQVYSESGVEVLLMFSSEQEEVGVMDRIF